VITDKLQDSVATYLRFGGFVDSQIKKGLLLSLSVKKSVNIWQSCEQERGSSRALSSSFSSVLARSTKCTRCMQLCQIIQIIRRLYKITERLSNKPFFIEQCTLALGGSVSVLDSGAEGPGFKSQLRRCRVTVLGKLFTPVVPLFTHAAKLVAHRRAYDSRHLQADWKEPGSAPETYAR